MSQHGSRRCARASHFERTHAQVVVQSLEGAVVDISKYAAQIVGPVCLDGTGKQAVGDASRVGVSSNSSVGVALDAVLNLEHALVRAAVDVCLAKRTYHAATVARVLAVHIEAAHYVSHHSISVGKSHQARSSVPCHQRAFDGQVLHRAAMEQPDKAFGIGFRLVVIVADGVSLSVDGPTEGNECVADRREAGTAKVDVVGNHGLCRVETSVHQSREVD